MSLDIATVPGQAESEAGGELDETNHSHAEPDGYSSTTPKWSNAHAILVLCLIIRACGSSDEEVVEGVVAPLQFEGVCGYSLEESVLHALALVPQIEETDNAETNFNAAVAADGGSFDTIKTDSEQSHVLSQVLKGELQAMDRGGIRHGHGYEF